MHIKVALLSLGCDKNRVDSEVMLGLLAEAGMEIVSEEEKAEVILINTCCFIKDALEESIETILEMAAYKKTGACKVLIITGCLGQRYQDEIFKEMPEVDAVIGTTAYEEVVSVIKQTLAAGGGQKILADTDRPMREENAGKRIVSTAGYYAYLKISEGCDNHCTYCIIPSLRGRHRSRSLESLLAEARQLAAHGVKELILVGQDTSIYGRDLYEESQLSVLLAALAQIEGIEWIRLLYCYPETLTQETIQVMASEEKICHYIDIPIQHCSDSVLKRMGRRVTKEALRKKIEALRKAMPDIVIRTTLIVGFPRETEEEFQELCDFVAEMKFERLGVFTFSPEEGTPAEKMEGQVPEEEKEKRKKEIMEIQKAIACEHCRKMEGQVIKTLIDGKLPDENIYCGRTYGDAPDIDGMVFVSGKGDYISGEWIPVLITESSDYDLIGEVYDEFSE